MTYGYSQRLVETNKAVSAESLGVVLGRMCIERNLSVAEVAKAIAVSRATVYNWFLGRTAPCQWSKKRIAEYIARLES